MSTDYPLNLLNELAGKTAFHVGPYRLACHPSIYYAVQRISDIQPMYQPMPMDRFMGIDIVVAPELGYGVWELYAGNRLIDYGRTKDG